MATKKATPKKSAKPRTIQVVDGDESAGAGTAKRRKSKASDDGKLSALDAAAKVLGESKEPLNTKQLIDAMAARGYWTSPGGKTPSQTLYSSLLREINLKGQESRFKKTDRGHFELQG